MKLVTKSKQPDPVDSPTRRPALGVLSDADLLEAWCRDQQPNALAILIKRYSVMVLSVCRRRCRSEADAEDAYQTTFLYLARNGHKIRHPERLVGWLHRVAQRSAVATLRSAKRETEPMIEPVIDTDDPLERLTQRHEAIVLDEELADLPEHYRSAIVMHLCEGLPLQEMAEHFGTTVGSIRGRLQRGKQLLSRRLRRRGIVPVVAFVAASAWTVSTSQATSAASSMVKMTAAPQLPDPPIAPKLLESLLSQGSRLMPTIYTAAGVLTGSALIALAMMGGATQGQNVSGKTELRLPTAAEPALTAQIMGATQGGGRGTTTPSPTDGMVWTEKTVTPPITSSLGKKLTEALDEETELEVVTDLAGLPPVLTRLLGMPVLMDQRAVKFAELDPKTITIEFTDSKIPLRTALHRMLSPHGLKAIVQDEGLMITADPSVLVHRGIGTSQWVNIDTEAEKRISEILDSKAEAEFVEIPLVAALRKISEQYKLPILADARALEDVGLSVDVPVTLSLSDVKLRTILKLLLRELELTYQVDDEMLSVTTTEAAEQNLASRIYWLEGTGFASGDFESVTALIQASIQPDAWEALGGPSTIAPIQSARPAIMISTTYRLHEDIEQLFNTLRESHFGKAPVREIVPTPRQQPRAVGGGGFF